MKVLVYPHSMNVGGSQMGAIELARAVADRGHEVALFAQDGPLVAKVHELGLRFIESPATVRRPSRAVMRRLTSLVRTDGFDVVHSYEWPPTMEAVYGPHTAARTPVVATVMSMAVAPFVPTHLPLVVSTELIKADCMSPRRRDVHVIEPIVDTVNDAPVERSGEFVATWGVEPGELLVVLVSRLAHEMKVGGLLEAIDAVAALPAGLRARLLIVGEGPARPEIEARAAAANAAAGREVVTMTGLLFDPRPAYAAADVVLGMGSSIMRGMAFGKPAVVQGESGFWELATDESLPLFIRQGWYGVGDGSSGVPKLTKILTELLSDEARRKELGAYSRHLMETRFSLSRAADLHIDLYRRAMETATARNPASLLRATAGLAAYKVQRKVARYRGRAAKDDFNSLGADLVRRGNRDVSAPGAAR